MRLVFVGERGSALACLALFPFVGALLGLLQSWGSAAGGALPVVSAAGVGLLFWALFAVQDLRLVRSRT